jgi:hypothetical protein
VAWVGAMAVDISIPTVDEQLIRRLPLPLAQLYWHACNARNPMDRHQAALFLWKVLLKLLGATALVEYAERGSHDPVVLERLKCLARPSLGHWREFVRLLVPLVAEGDEGFAKLHAVLDGKVRDDFPRLAGLDVTLRQKLESRGEARSTVEPGKLLDWIVEYRNTIAHGGLRNEQRDDRLARALVAGAPDPTAAVAARAVVSACVQCEESDGSASGGAVPVGGAAQVARSDGHRRVRRARHSRSGGAGAAKEPRSDQPRSRAGSSCGRACRRWRRGKMGPPIRERF